MSEFIEIPLHRGLYIIDSLILFPTVILLLRPDIQHHADCEEVESARREQEKLSGVKEGKTEQKDVQSSVKQGFALIAIMAVGAFLFMI